MLKYSKACTGTGVTVRLKLTRVARRRPYPFHITDFTKLLTWRFVKKMPFHVLVWQIGCNIRRLISLRACIDQGRRSSFENFAAVRQPHSACFWSPKRSRRAYKAENCDLPMNDIKHHWNLWPSVDQKLQTVQQAIQKIQSIHNGDMTTFNHCFE